MRITIILLLLFHSCALFSQHFDTVHLNNNPKYSYAYFHKGISYFELNNYNAAVICYDKAIQLDKNFTRAYYNRGNAKFESQNLSGACDDWNKSKILGHTTAYVMIDKYCK